MASLWDDSVWSKNMFKRGGGLGKDASPNKIGSSSPDLPRSTPPALSLPLPLPSGSFHEGSKLGSASGYSNSSRPGRGFQHWRPVFAIICALTTFALYRSFTYAHLWGSTSPTVTTTTRGSEVWAKGMESLLDRGVTCDPRFATLKVFMYDLPADFHFGMTATFEPSLDADDVWPRNLSDLPRYPGSLYQQHSPEYWLTADLLTSTMPERKTECTAVRVFNPLLADIFFVPFFASLSYNKYTKVEHDGQDQNELLQRQLVSFLKNQTWWQLSGGKDHVIVIHHPNSLHWVRDQLSPAMYVVCDFGRYPDWMANIRKDIVAPYKHVVGTFKGDGAQFRSRPLLLFFQGAIVRKQGGIIRQQLYELLKDEAGVHFAAGNTQSNGVKSATTGMRSSKFCLHLAGDTPSSNRLFDAIASHCVPVIISDEIELPYEDELDYSEFCLFVRSEDALKKDFVINLLRSVQADEWTRMWKRLKTVALHFEYQHPTVPGDAVNMLWRAISRRIPAVKMALNKDKRYARSGWVRPAFQPPPGAAPYERPTAVGVAASRAEKEQRKTNYDESKSLNQNYRS